MRIQIAIVTAVGLIAGEAAASSILQIEGDSVESSRSVTVISQNAASSSVDVLDADGMTQVSKSVVAVGEPSVSGERVAAINNDALPTVLRGGVVGDALPAPVVEPEPVKKLSRPAQRAKERNERRAIREAVRFGEPLPQKTETQQATDQPTTAPESGS